MKLSKLMEKSVEKGLKIRIVIDNGVMQIVVVKPGEVKREFTATINDSATITEAIVSEWLGKVE